MFGVGVCVCLTLNTHRDRRWDRSAVEGWCASASAGTADAAALRASVGNDDGRSLSSLSLPHTIREQYRIIGLRFRHPLPSQPLSKYHVVINVGALAFANPVPGSQSRTTGILRNTHNSQRALVIISRELATWHFLRPGVATVAGEGHSRLISGEGLSKLGGGLAPQAIFVCGFELEKKR